MQTDRSHLADQHHPSPYLPLPHSMEASRKNRYSMLYKAQDEHSPPRGYHQVVVVIILCMSHLLTQAGLGQAIAPLYIIADDLNPRSPGELRWYAAAYSLTAGTFILIAGRLGDMYGNRLMVIVGYVWFAVWSLVAGFGVYGGHILFIVSRALQGIGPAILLPNSLAILGRVYPPGWKKNVVFCVFGALAPNGFVLGALFSSIFAELAWWPWAYWVMAIVCVVLSILTYLVVPAPASLSTADRGTLDIFGSITGVAGLVVFNIAWNQGPSVGWQNAYTYILLIIGVVLFTLFFVIESRVKYPVVPVKVFNLDTIFLLGCIGCGWSSFGIWLFYTWELSMTLRHYRPLSVAAQFVPVGVSGILAAASVPFLMRRFGPQYIMLLSMTAFTVGSVLIATAPVHQVYWAQTFVSIIVMPWGMDLSFPSANLILSNSTPREHQGVAASLVNTVINYSIAIGLGVAGTVESQVNRDGRDVLRGFRGAYYAGIGLAAASLIISLVFVVKRFRRVEVSQLKTADSSHNSSTTEVGSGTEIG